MSLHVKESSSCADLTATVDALLDRIYPIGIIIQLMVTDNPGTLFGIGTWTQIAKGKTLVGVDQNGEESNVESGNFYKENLTGGNYFVSHNHWVNAHSHTVNSHTHSTGNHTLTLNEIPRHNHAFGFEANQSASRPTANPGSQGLAGCYASNDCAGFTGYNSSTAYVGGGAAHNHGNTGSSSPRTSSAGGQNTNEQVIDVKQPYLTCYIWQRTA